MRALIVSILIAGILLAGCSEPNPPPPYQSLGDIKHFMDHLLEPAADKLWDSAGSIITAEGEQDLAPQTDEEWLAVRHSANVVAEAGNLLMMPGYSRDEADWIEISSGLTTVGQRVIAAAEAKDAVALFDTGAELYNVCVSCHQLYMAKDGEAGSAPGGE
ncbi:MAG: hypothetical protein O2780_16635 [Proteobacteria bacterium]|jgi:hypothetical protein|nr:hypothetical protein [Pseudomonadota bacterium]MDA1302191.1 hypothetical protein [Pseudomonadota bacterium]